MNSITPVKVGSYINFDVQRVVTTLYNHRYYAQKKYTGKVIDIMEKDCIETYKVKVRNENTYFEVPRFKITHVWFTV